MDDFFVRSVRISIERTINEIYIEGNPNVKDCFREKFFFCIFCIFCFFLINIFNYVCLQVIYHSHCYGENDIITRTIRIEEKLYDNGELLWYMHELF